MKSLAFIILLLSRFTVYAQEEAEPILNQIKQKLNSIEDYSVDVEVSVNMDFLKMPKSKAKLYYKKPDKFKFHSNSFAILPKAGIDFNPQKILNKEYKAEILKDTVLDEPHFSLIQLVPSSDSAAFIKANLLVDTQELLLLELNLFSESGSNVSTKFDYGEQKEFSLPSSLNIEFNFAENEDEKPNRRRRIPQNFKGKLKIEYFNYIINEGIEDSIFVDKKDNQNEEPER